MKNDVELKARREDGALSNLHTADGTWIYECDDEWWRRIEVTARTDISDCSKCDAAIHTIRTSARSF